MYKTIVVPLDGSLLSESAIEPALELAKRTGATVHLVTCTWAGDPLMPRTDARDYLDTRVEVLKPRKIESTMLSEREPGEAIVTLARHLPDAIVCMTTHGRSGLGQALLGSVAEQVAREVDGPLLLLGPDAAGVLPLDRALVAIDDSAASLQVAHLAADWAREFGIELTLVEVIDPDDLERARTATREPIVEDTALRQMASTIDDGTIAITWEVLHGDDPAESLLDFARRSPASLVFLGTHGRTGAARVFVGSVAMRVARHAPCPIVLLHPVGAGTSVRVNELGAPQEQITVMTG